MPMRVVPREISLIAHTRVKLEVLARLQPKWFNGVGTEGDPLILTEFAGRACYQSWTRPTASTANNAAYMLNIIRQRHFSVLGHPTATFYLTGVSRSYTHEMIRHSEGFEYSQLSQRFVDSSDVKVVVPPALRADEAVRVYEEVLEAIGTAYGAVVKLLAARNASRKQIREAARAILPNMAETRIVVTGNFRSWRHFILMRATSASDAEIREIALEVYDQLKAEWPDFFPDFVEKKDSEGNRVLSSPYMEETYG